MKRITVLLMVITIVLSLFIVSACSGDVKETYSTDFSESTFSETENNLQSETESSSSAVEKTEASQSTEKTEEATQLSEEAQIEILTKGNFLLDNAMNSDGEEYPYGSVANDTGTFIKFYDNKTFECTLGANYFKGTYSLSDGDIIIDVTESYDAKGDREFDYDNVITWEHDYNILAFEYDGIINMFSDHNAWVNMNIICSDISYQAFTAITLLNKNIRIIDGLINDILFIAGIINMYGLHIY